MWPVFQQEHCHGPSGCLKQPFTAVSAYCSVSHAAACTYLLLLLLLLLQLLLV